MRIVFITMFLLCSYLFGATYPKLFEQLGTPLFKSAEIIGALGSIEQLEPYVDDFTTEASKVREVGLKIDSLKAESDKKQYLKSLRLLQRHHEKIIAASTRVLLDSIEQDDYETFKTLVEFGMDDYAPNHILNEQIISYYQTNSQRGKIYILDQIIEENKDVIMVYSQPDHSISYTGSSTAHVTTAKQQVEVRQKKVVMVFRPGCPYCRKAKNFLNSQGIKYTGYNVNGGYGATLFRRYHGTGVPLIIIGDKVIRGYSPVKIIEALQ